MLMLLFHAGGEKFSCPCEHISEIIPQVEVKPIYHMPDFVKGSINYGGKPIPVIDWPQLIQGKPSCHSLHTRIILFSFTGGDQEYEFGLMAEQVTKTLEAPLEEFIEGGGVAKDYPYLGGILTRGKETIQFVNVQRLFDFLKNTLYEIAQ